MVFIFFSSGPTLLRTTVVCFLFKHTNDYFFIFLRQHQQLLVDEVTSSIPSLSFRFHTFTYVCSQQRNTSICTCAINSFHRLDETLDTELSPLDGPKKCLKPLVHLQPSGLPRGCRTHPNMRGDLYRIITLCETGELTHKNGQGILAPRSICSLFWNSILTYLKLSKIQKCFVHIPTSYMSTKLFQGKPIFMWPK
jgi:hypothetical protein